MKKFKKLIAIFAFLIMSSSTLAGCLDKQPAIKNATIINVDDTYYVGDTIDFSNFILMITTEDGKTKTIPVTENMITLPDTNSEGEKNIVVNYQGKQYTVTINVQQKPSVLAGKLAQFLRDFQNSNGTTNVKISGIADIVAKYLNEEQQIDKNSFSVSLNKNQIADTDALLEALFTAITNGVFNASFEVESNNILHKTELVAKLDVVKALTKAYTNIQTFNFNNYLFDKAFPNGTSDIVNPLVDEIVNKFDVSFVGKSKLRTLFTSVVNTLKQGQFVDILQNTQEIWIMLLQCLKI